MQINFCLQHIISRECHANLFYLVLTTFIYCTQANKIKKYYTRLPICKLRKDANIHNVQLKVYFSKVFVNEVVEVV
jgi:hypothetical protein